MAPGRVFYLLRGRCQRNAESAQLAVWDWPTPTDVRLMPEVSTQGQPGPATTSAWSVSRVDRPVNAQPALKRREGSRCGRKLAV